MEIDIEYVSEDFKFTNLLPDIFDDNENQTIKNAADKKKYFLYFMDAQRVFVKALGKGINEDFKYIPSTDGEYHADFMLIKNSQSGQVYSFNLADHYLGAVAFEGLVFIPKNLEWYIVPNTMNDLLKMAPVRRN